jgi:hypothetical protein
LTKLKGVFNKAIDDATANHPETAKLVQKYDDTLFNYRNTALEKLSNDFWTWSK